jgi:hypothetical protein
MQPATMAEVARATQSEESRLAEMEFGLFV